MADNGEWATQRRLRWEADEREKREAAEKQRQIKANGEKWGLEARAKGIDDPDKCKEVASIAADIMAEAMTRPGTVFFRDDRGVVEEAIMKLEKAEQQSLQMPPVVEASLTEQFRATAHEVFDRKAPPPPPPSATNPTANNGPEPPDKSPTPNAAARPTSPRTPPAGGNAQSRLTADEILQSANDPALRARYNEDHQTRDREQKSAAASADPATKSAAQGSSPADAARAPRPLADRYKTSELQKRADEEAARRAKELNPGRGRGGGRGR